MSPRAAANCFRIFMGRFRSRRFGWVKPLPLGANGKHVFPELGKEDLY